VKWPKPYRNWGTTFTSSRLFNEPEIFVGPTSRRPIYDLQMVFKTLDVIGRYKPDLMHAHGYEAALAAWLCRLVSGVPYVYSGHNTMLDELPSYGVLRPKWAANLLARLLDSFVPRMANRCIPHSANMGKFFQDMGLGGRTEPVVPFGINLDEPISGSGRNVRARFGLGDRPIIMYSGLLDEFQRIDLLLDAMQVVRDGFGEPRAKLLIVQTLPNEKHAGNLRRRIAEMNLDEHVILTDPQPLAAVPEFLLASDVAVVPRPHVPGFPIKLLNYMAAARPCVMFASSATSGLVHGKNAYLAPEDTGRSLGAGILAVLRDQPLQKVLARGGNRFVRERHDRRLVADQLVRAYCRTIGRPAPPPAMQPVNLAPAEDEIHGNGDLSGARQPAGEPCLAMCEPFPSMLGVADTLSLGELRNVRA